MATPPGITPYELYVEEPVKLVPALKVEQYLHTGMVQDPVWLCLLVEFTEMKKAQR